MGPLEILLVIILALLIFGPDKLPEIASKMGNVYRNLTKATNELTKTINTEISLEKELKVKPATEPPQTESQSKENAKIEPLPITSQSTEPPENITIEEDKEPETVGTESDKESNG